MSQSEKESEDRLKSEFIERLAERSDAVSIDYLLNETSAENRSEAKEVLRTMIDEGMISTTPGFKYKLASNISATE